MTSPAIRGLCGFLCGLAVAGAVLAQVQAQPVDLFGALPEPPTEREIPPVHDPANPDARRLQAPREAFSALPLDRQGKPDWMKALRARQIEPRSAIRAAPQPVPLLQLDILMKNTAGMPFVNFPHEGHTQWLACANCHDAIFAPKAGGNAINMNRIFLGEACGVCHGKVAFTPMVQCERCHSVPQPGQKPWW